ncbi:MAG: hypothetical protein HW421_1883, partial [Ignavibacteria bacterium]|nr:hypothetical protein [Ignavibacteria bacterium]
LRLCKLFSFSFNLQMIINKILTIFCCFSSGAKQINDTYYGLHIYNREKDKFSIYREVRAVGKSKNVLFVDSENNLWFSSRDSGLYKYNKKNNPEIQRIMNLNFKKNNSFEKFVTSIIEDKSKQLWMGTWSEGLKIYNLKTNELTTFKNEPGNSKSLSWNFINFLYQDRSGLIFIGTAGGSDIVDINSNKFKFINPFYNEGKTSFNTSFFSSFYEEKNGNLILGTDNGLLSYNRKFQKIIPFAKNSRLASFLKGRFITSIIQNKQGTLFIGSFKGLTIIRKDKLNFKHYLKEININKLFCDSDNNIWIGCDKNGIKKFDYNSNECIDLNEIINSPNQALINKRTVNNIIEDKNGMLYFLVSGVGITIFDKKTNQFNKLYFNSKDSVKLSDGIDKFYIDKNNLIWMSTSKGLFNYNTLSKILNHINIQTANGKFDINSIQEDNEGYLWFSSKIGIIRFNPKNNKFKIYDKKNGLPVAYFISGSYKSNDGDLFFSCVNGFITFKPSEFKVDNYCPQVVISSIEALNNKNGQNIKFKNINEIPEINLTYMFNSISIKFSALDFYNPLLINYAYKLEGEGKEWINIGNSKAVNFSNLPPGEYLFKVKSTNRDGVWGENYKTLKIIITPPYWSTTWFLIIVIIFALFLIYLLYRFRVRRIKKINELLEQQVNSRTSEINEQKQILENQNLELDALNSDLAEKNIQISKEQEISEKLLLNVLPESIATRLKEGETTIADHFEEASVVFIDIVDFTKSSARSDPKRVVNVLNVLYSKLDKIAQKHGLEKIKTIGDCYMAAAGIPVADPDNVSKAAQFALEAMSLLKDYDTGTGTILNFRCGVDCGQVVAGVIGENKFIYDVWGDMVNTASRMETNGVAGKIQCTERFREKLRITNYELRFDFEERGEIEIKGKGMMRTWFLYHIDS